MAVAHRHEMPERGDLPVNISDEMWQLWTRCWSRVPEERPSMADVLDLLPHILSCLVITPKLDILVPEIIKDSSDSSTD